MSSISLRVHVSMLIDLVSLMIDTSYPFFAKSINLPFRKCYGISISELKMDWMYRNN
jgi:hypothetical protein